MPLTLEERVDTVENTLVKHDERISACEKYDIEQTLDFMSKMTKFEISLNSALTQMTSVMNTNKTMIKILVWTVVTLLTILGSICGVKVAAPEWLAGL